MRLVHLSRAAALSLLIGVFASVSAQVPPSGTGGPSVSTGSRIVSPAVVATWIAHGESSGPSALDLLVLWRGTPGWFMRGSGSGGSSAGSGATAATIKLGIKFGGLDLKLEFDSQARSARIQGKEIVLRGANVILVDLVDSAEGPQVVGTVFVDPQLPASAMQLEPALRRSPELVSFLRCDARLPDPKLQGMLDHTCAQVMEK